LRANVIKATYRVLSFLAIVFPLATNISCLSLWAVSNPFW